MKFLGSKKFRVLAGDILLYAAGLIVAFPIRYLGEFPAFNFIPTLRVLPLFILTFLILANIYNLYSEYQKYDDTVASLVCIILLSAFINMATAFFFRQFSVPRTIIALSSVLQFILLALWRAFVWKKSLLIEQIRSAIIIGSAREIHSLRNSITQTMSRGIQILQELHISAEHPENFSPRWQALQAQPLLKTVDTLILCSSVPMQHRAELLDFAIRQDKTVMLVPGVYELVLQNARLISAGDMPVMQLKSMNTPPHLAFAKRVMDICLSIPALLVLSPVMLVIALAIKLDSPGPVFYIQPRIGLKDREIRVCKFRTMRADAEKAGPMLAEENDPRITRVGRFLRKTRLDELPQFWNVLTGEMSLVGPRPEREHFINQYLEDLPEFSYRTNIKAGITGLAQVEGNYTTDPGNKLKYDLFYAQNQSIANDIVILMRTAKVIVLKDKAQ